MNKFEACVGKNGELIFAEKFSLRYGLKPGAKVRVDETPVLRDRKPRQN